MKVNFDEYYEKKKKNICFETYFIEGEQFNFKLEDMFELLDIKDENLLKKYIYYLDCYRVNFFYIENYEDAIIKFVSVISDDEDKAKLLKMFIRHETLFCNESGIKRLSLVPDKYNKRKLNRSFV